MKEMPTLFTPDRAFQIAEGYFAKGKWFEATTFYNETVNSIPEGSPYKAAIPQVNNKLIICRSKMNGLS